MKKKNAAVYIVISLISAACGVRGDPVPPRLAPELSRGQPAYKRATEDLAFPAVPPVYAPKEKDEAKKENEKKSN